MTIPLGSTAVTGAAANLIINQVYIVDEANNSTVILDGPSNTVTSTILDNIGSLPLFVAVNKSKNQYVLASGKVGAVYDGATNTPLVSIHTDPNVVGNATFQSMVLNEVTNKLYSSTGGGVLVTDLATGAVNVFAIPFLKVGEICTVHSLAVNQANWVYAVTQCKLASAAMFIFDGTTGATLQTVDLGSSIPFGANVVEMALNAKSNKLYLANYGGFGINTQTPVPPSVEVYNAATLAHLASIPNVVGPLAVDSVLNGAADAPSALRTAISRLRASDRTSTRLAIFTHEMNSSNAAPLKSTKRIGRIFPTITSVSGDKAAPCPRFVSGNCFSSCSAISVTFAKAVWKDTPSLSRAMP